MTNRRPPGPELPGESRRSKALSLFLLSPSAAAAEYPDLIDDLCRFILSSTNPFAAASDEQKAKDGSETQFDDWNRVRDWVKSTR